MLFLNNEKVTKEEFISALGLKEILGLTDDVKTFKIDPKKPKEFEYIPEIMKPDKFGIFGKVAAAPRHIPRRYMTKDADGDSVEVRYSKSLPQNSPDGKPVYASDPKEVWHFTKTFIEGEEELFLFMLANPECKTSKHTNKNVYYQLKDRDFELKLQMAKEDKMDEAYAYIKSLAGQVLVIKALGAGITDAYAIYDTEGESALRLKLRQMATENPFKLMQQLAQDSTDIIGKIRYAVGKSMIEKKPTGLPGQHVWIFSDGTEICKVSGTENAETALNDQLLHSAELFRKLSNMIDKEVSPEALAQLKRKIVDTAEKVTALIDAELLTYDVTTKQVHWVVKGDIIPEPVLKVKRSFKQEMVEAIEKNKSLSDEINSKYEQAKKKTLV